jgi:hypothetical protein
MVVAEAVTLLSVDFVVHERCAGRRPSTPADVAVTDVHIRLGEYAPRT